MKQNAAKGQQSALAGKGGALKTIVSGWGSSTLNLAYPTSSFIPLDDRGTASAEGEATNYRHARTAQVKGTCRRAGLCGQAGALNAWSPCREPDALGPVSWRGDFDPAPQVAI
jgi:hypothetical protein